MHIISEKIKKFGLINILDFALVLFVILIITAVYVYTHAPPRVREHKDVVFQMYFIDVPYSVGQDLFVPGNEFIATYSKDDRAIIIAAEPLNIFIMKNSSSSLNAFQEISGYEGYKSDYLITINSSLEIDAEGDLLFNDQNIGPGNILYLQLNNSYLRGLVWRVGYTNKTELKNITVAINKIENPSYHLLLEGESLFSYDITDGKITSVINDFDYLNVTVEVSANMYEGEYLFHEYPLAISYRFIFRTKNAKYVGKIVGVS